VGLLSPLLTFLEIKMSIRVKQTDSKGWEFNQKNFPDGSWFVFADELYRVQTWTLGKDGELYTDVIRYSGNHPTVERFHEDDIEVYLKAEVTKFEVEIEYRRG